ncbi:MAG: RNA-guided pseudouridylation complex pseudouridine synthase subunit Cbf5 [Candidatus Thermoplasmatota archaeon]|nr:RNA-guided pseudouridylation complex pseudouridine synthase subunit Cbf5 [Candidatus Thermoplasmatota archaeon]
MLIKAIASTDPRYGKKPEDRSIEELLNCSFINLDKPAGPTSHQVTLWVRDVLHAKRTGHSGTLDPNASGVLPIGVNRATKLLGYLLLGTKEYVALMRLHKDATEDMVRNVFSEFVGRIEQRVPLRSAVKKRKRMRNVHELEILEMNGKNVLFRAVVDPGTYIRTLCVDIGKALGTGANMVQLIRTRSSVFHESDSFILQDVVDAYAVKEEKEDLKSILLPVEYGFSELPKIVVRDSSISALCHGADLALPGILQIDERIVKGSVVCIFSLKGELVAIGKAMMDADEMWEKERGIAVDIESVAMERSTYPRLWD